MFQFFQSSRSSHCQVNARQVQNTLRQEAGYSFTLSKVRSFIMPQRVHNYFIHFLNINSIGSLAEPPHRNMDELDDLLTSGACSAEKEQEQLQNKMINEEYKIWKKNSVFLYDIMYRLVRTAPFPLTLLADVYPAGPSNGPPSPRNGCRTSRIYRARPSAPIVCCSAHTHPTAPPTISRSHISTYPSHQPRASPTTIPKKKSSADTVQRRSLSTFPSCRRSSTLAKSTRHGTNHRILTS